MCCWTCCGTGWAESLDLVEHLVERPNRAWWPPRTPVRRSTVGSWAMNDSPGQGSVTPHHPAVSEHVARPAGLHHDADGTIAVEGD
jgi:hypothetical protein